MEYSLIFAEGFLIYYVLLAINIQHCMNTLFYLVCLLMLSLRHEPYMRQEILSFFYFFFFYLFTP